MEHRHAVEARDGQALLSARHPLRTVDATAGEAP
ncbi:hypothetical protein SAMN05444365_102494 [Micromonospora pattaloongensis]|uniref:Uncharacterized protein n=1 Tax=Micromonospora pattaloongensis TaxID=405436 RepID=A0A1H3KHZ8_9ACTN|nr:hypothetical protein SAMN05444365_102494 [Micromonospora pattaloongensis]